MKNGKADRTRADDILEKAGVSRTAAPTISEAEATAWPTLHALLCLDSPEADGRIAAPSSISIFRVGPTFRAAVRLKRQQLVLWVGARTLIGLLDAIEKELASDQPAWQEEQGGDGDKVLVKLLQGLTRPGTIPVPRRIN